MSTDASYYDSDDELNEKGIERVLELIEVVKSETSLIESEVCASCSGSGRYDDTGSPKCAACRGRGRVPSDDEAMRSLVGHMNELDDLDWREAKVASARVKEHMMFLDLGWENEYYWT